MIEYTGRLSIEIREVSCLCIESVCFLEESSKCIFCRRIHGTREVRIDDAMPDICSETETTLLTRTVHFFLFIIGERLISEVYIGKNARE